MKAYKVTVNGVAYEVQVEALTSVPTAPMATPVAAAPVAAAPAPVAPGAGTQVTSPMPGTILSCTLTAGAAVKKGQVLMVLEAMKMENEIMCPQDGTVVSVNTSAGSAVEAGALLCVIG